MMATNISWCDETWTIVTGCSKVSAGCKNCYAERLAPRLAAMGKPGYTDKPWTVGNAAENVTLRPERLEEPLHWKKPRRVFVTSMGDLFHELVPDDFIWQVFGVMARARRHTFQVLTKRPERMAAFTNDPDWHVKLAAGSVAATPGQLVPFSEISEWPLPNVQLGTSVEDERVLGRLGHLLRTIAAVRFVSFEPLIGPVDARPYIQLTVENEWRGTEADEERGWGYDGHSGGFVHPMQGGDAIYDPQPGIHWFIVGGESGPGYRPMDLAWARSLRDQAAAAEIAFFGKQSSGAKNEMPLPPDLQIRQMPEVARAR
jgi:protein gp37